uniref:Uncharacterized protein n=1 Tax=Anopheles atroparvus TaxID=41427 RepID=A0A182INW6_ANOAO
MAPELSNFDYDSTVHQQYSAHNPIDQYVLLAKNAKGAACLELIKQVLEAQGVHVFGELLAMPNIQEIANLKKAIKTQAVESDEAMATDACREVVGGLDLRKKSTKSKSLKGCGKSWFKNFS